ncbi:Multidrug ABC transporter permease [Kitasatospora sp. MMS16-BH015]|uniref:ABC transporter permease n=1 Tax=Kitasatospora sp. MMS16-BH015 TaxID=2018025 RepID=UPI000CA1B9C3|nr:ABC transporter permease [Kitasatospora sp. MMS16-BH015]AUG81634.1 Multidrug ABC transporter permease [Kitasatospora sp. MMS16-BH015]
MTTATTSWIIFQRSMRYTLRNPSWVIFGLAQPLLYLALFGPLLSRIAQAPGFEGGNTWRVFVPGLLVQQGVFSAVFVGFGIISEIRAGVLDRMRISAASELGLLLGRMLRDAVVLTAQAVLLTLGALVAGLRAPVGGVLTAFALVTVVGLAMAGLAYGLALLVKNEEAYGQLINALMLPTLLLSGVLLPLALAPGWLAGLAKANPLSYIVTAERALFAGQFGQSQALVGIGVAIGLAAFTTWFASRAIRSGS